MAGFDDAAIGMRWRRRFKSSVAEGLNRSRLDRVVGAWRGRTREPLVLGYHRVVADFAASAELAMPSLLVSAATLARQLEFVGRHREFVSLDELALVLNGERKVRKPVAVVTFDDGYRDVWEHGLPVLQRLGVPGAAYVVSDLTGTSQLQRHDELYLLFTLLQRQDRKARFPLLQQLVQEAAAALPLAMQLRAQIDGNSTPLQLTRFVIEARLPPFMPQVLRALRRHVSLDGQSLQPLQSMDWDMLKDLLAAGVTVGSHTCSHPLLPALPAAQIRDELERSSRMLRSRLGVAVNHLAYPDGRFNAATVDAAVAVGYRTATTICSHVDPRHPLLTIPRRILWERSSNDARGEFSPAMLSCQINGIFDPARRCRLQH